LIFGVDEAGRGPLAGPVVCAAVLLCDGGIDGLDDSKKLSAKRRAVLEAQIMERCAYAVVEVAPDEIDLLNILHATMAGMARAVDALMEKIGAAQTGGPVEVLVDGNRLPKWNYPARAIIGGDAIHPCISAASILAKEHRDRIMKAAARDYPAYGWERNMGYPTAEHREALRQFGPTPLHRMSYAPVAQAALKLE
jgi:ribonuclease HII